MVKRETWSAEQVGAFDLRNTCYHEAAHCVVAKLFGAYAYVTIDGPRAVDLLEEKVWVGQCHYYAPALDNHQRKLVGLAGLAADIRRNDPRCNLDDLSCALEHEVYELSDKDRQATGNTSVDDHLECAALVRRLWPEIEKLAAQLIRVHSMKDNHDKA